FSEDVTTSVIDTLSLHDALPICGARAWAHGAGGPSDGPGNRPRPGRRRRRRGGRPDDPGGGGVRAARALPPPGGAPARRGGGSRSEEHTSELQSRENLVCRLLLE